MKIIQAKKQNDFEEWDNFVVNNTRGNHLILSDWLDSFKSYGFEKEVFFVKENNCIIGGFGAVIAKFSIFKFYIVPYGPLVEENNQNQIVDLIEEAKKRAISNSCCYFQIAVPKSSSEDIALYSYSEKFLLNKKYKQGKLFKYVYSADGVNFVNLKGFDFENSEDLLMSFSVRTRRDIRIGIKNIDTIIQAKDYNQIKEAYDLCLLNAKQLNYSIRDWKSISQTLFDLISSDKGIFLMAFNNGNLVGSTFFVKSGNHLTYIFGGTKKEASNIYPGYALQWEAIKISLQLGYEWYNISLGGSQGVKKFKSKFNTKSIYYENAHYHIVLNSLKFRLFMFVEKRIKPYKSTIAKWLSFIK